MKVRNFRPCRWLLVPAVLVSLIGTASAMWIRISEPVPTDRLIANVSAYVEQNPRDAHGHYVLGRIHSLAFAQGTDTLSVVPPGKDSSEKNKYLPGFEGSESVQVARETKGKVLTPAAQVYLWQSIWHYWEATQLDSKNALYFLGLGWMLEQGTPFVDQAGLPWMTESAFPLDETARLKWLKEVALLGSKNSKESNAAMLRLRAQLPNIAPLLAEVVQKNKNAIARPKIISLLILHWRTKALSAYRRAYALRIAGDLKETHLFRAGDNPISIEAGEGILRLLKALKGNALLPGEKREQARVQKAIKTIISKPYVVTPILIPMGQATALKEILAPEKTVSFDLAGNGIAARWSWVRPDTGILVWDPDATGHITSGRQLFGSVTWWMFWRDGYQALAALDDNRNGWLEGEEINGLAVWRDSDSDGVSDPGEVLPLRAAGVASIATNPTGHDGKVLLNPQGCRLSDGTLRPTYDWIAEPLAF